MHFLCWSWKYFSFITDSICLWNFLYICFFFGKQPNFFGQVVKNLDFGHIILSRIVVSWCRSQFVICLEANYYQYYNSKYFYYIAGRFVEGLKWNLTPRLFFLRNTNTPMYLAAKDSEIQFMKFIFLWCIIDIAGIVLQIF